VSYSFSAPTSRVERTIIFLDGHITCLREGCNKSVVPLGSSEHANAQDGGITRGFGAFTSYQVTPPSLQSTSTPVR